MGSLLYRLLLIAASLCVGLPPTVQAEAFRLTEPFLGNSRSTASPAWVPQSYINSAPDAIRALPETTQWLIDRYVAAGGLPGSGECIQFGDTSSESELFTQKLASSLNSVVDAALTILVGRVSRVEAGLWYGTPASIAEVKVSEWIWTYKDSRADMAKAVYLLLPKADFQVGRFRLCTSDSRWTQFPGAGNRIVLLSLFPQWLDPQLFDLGTLPLELAFEDSKGLAVVPGALEQAGAASSGLDFDVFVDLVRELSAKNARSSQGEPSSPRPSYRHF